MTRVAGRLAGHLRARLRAAVGSPGGAPADPESGQVLVLLIGTVVVVLGLVTAVVAASGVHLDRVRLLALADATALAAADAVAEQRYLSGIDAPGAATPGAIPLHDADVRAAATDYLAAHPDLGLDRVELVAAGSPDGRTAEVHLRAVVRPRLLSWVTAAWWSGITLDATATARAW